MVVLRNIGSHTISCNNRRRRRIAHRQPADLRRRRDISFLERGRQTQHARNIVEPEARIVRRKELRRIHIEREHDAILVKKPGEVGSGGNSGFQALNLAVQFGALGILLIGFDMKADGNSPHWYGRNDWVGCANPMEHNYQRWCRAFDTSAVRLAELGVARISVGGAFAFAALGALAEAAQELRSAGTYGYLRGAAARRKIADTAFSA